MEDEETPLRQKRGETTLMTIESASNRKTVKRSMTFGTSSIDVSDIQGFLYIWYFICKHNYFWNLQIGTKPHPLTRFNRPPVDYDSYEGTHPKQLIRNRENGRDNILDVTDIDVFINLLLIGY